MRKIIIEVLHCYQCPNFFRDDYDHSYMCCGHIKFDYGYDGDVDNRIKEEDLVNGFPEFCPLKEENK